MPIKNVTDKGLSFPMIGKIRKGEKVDIGQGRSRPVDLDYFKIEFEPQFEHLAEKFFAHYPAEPKEIQVTLPFNEIERMWDAFLEAYTASRLLARSDGKPEDGGIIIYQCDGKTGEVIVANGKDVKTGMVVPHPENNIAGYDYQNKPIEFSPIGRLKVIIPVLEEAAYMQLTTGSWWDIQNISQQLAGLKELNNGVIKGIPLTLMRSDQEIMAPINGKRTRVTKSLISIKADSDWVAARIQADRNAAFPQLIANTMLDPSNIDYEEELQRLPASTETALEGEIINDDTIPAVEPENVLETPQDGPVANPARPYDAETLKNRLQEMIATYDTYVARDPGRYAVSLDTDKQLVAAAIGKHFDDTARYAIFRYLLGPNKGSTKTWTGSEMGAVKNIWLDILGFDEELGGIQFQELTNAWNAAQASEGQLQAF